MHITDAHMHISPVFSGDNVLRFMDRTETDKAVLQSVFYTDFGPLTPLALNMKKKDPSKFYVFGAPDARLYNTRADCIGKAQIESIKPFLDAGMDGVKLLEGKPQMRKAYPIPPFDSEVWEPFFSFLEENSIPVMWHVNDPSGFWSKKVSPWLVKQGWAYDESFINNEDQYSEVLRVVSRHIKLKVIFAHFFFMSDDLDRLSDILDAHPCVSVDITPGIEMYENFSAAATKAAAFFQKYSQRILYGTDIGGRCILTNEGCPFNEKENLRRPEIVRYYLSSKSERVIEPDDDYLIGRKPFIMKPLGLEEDILSRVYYGNLENILSR